MTEFQVLGCRAYAYLDFYQPFYPQFLSNHIHGRQQLQNQGAEVEYPTSLNNPGWDLKVNGVEVQAKIGSSKLIEEH